MKLQELTFALKQAQPAAEDAAPHLVDHVELTTKSLWKQMKDAFIAKFEVTLKKIHWPSKDSIVDGRLKEEWTQGVGQLLELQGPELQSRKKETETTKHRHEPIVLLPLEAMVKPLELKFKYHFEGDRPTNRLDKVCINVNSQELTNRCSRNTSSPTWSIC